MIRLTVRCRPELADRALAELLELNPNGVEEEHGAEYVEFAVYGAPGELPSLPELEAAAGEGVVEIGSTEIPDDWADRWRDFHEPVIVGDGRLVVRPSWSEPHPGANPAGAEAGAQQERPRRRRGQDVLAGAEQPAGIDVVIDPGRAFGTGAHATTRMCLELLLQLADAGGAGGGLVDLGTGSGVLAIAAAKLGWSPVLGVDHEQPALATAAANARANEVELELRRVNLRQEAPPTAPTVAANLTGPLLRDVAAALRPPLPESFLCSGMLASEAETVARDFGEIGFTTRRRARDGDWVAICFDCP
ncbi:MAG: 50S ribosomal protein L11 methyltransferase [Solirubrobacterales bacterium]